jgi:molybdopterin synthase catalytic subunit
MSARISETALDPAAALDEVAGDGGAACVFAGTVRRSNRGREVVALSYESHRSLAERVLRELEEEAEARDGVRSCRVVHRVGTLEVGEVSVVVAVAADDHDVAVDAAERTMDELKERVPMWKEERYADGTSRHLDGHPLRSGSPAPGGGEPGADGSHADGDDGVGGGGT